MRIKVECTNASQVDCDLLVVNLFDGVKKPGGATGAIDNALGGLITELIAAKEISGKLGKVTTIHSLGKLKAKRVLVVGLGKSKDFDLDKSRIASAAAIKEAKKVKAKKVATIVHGAGVGGLEAKEASRAVVEGSILGAYEFKGYAEEREEPIFEVDELIIVEYVPQKIKEIEEGAKVGEIISFATNRARDLVNTPANKKTPAMLSKYAEDLAKETGIKCEILSLKDIEKMGMDAFLSVAKGSKEEAKMVVLKYEEASKAKKKEIIGLIGKGITFDSGGISIKTGKDLSSMFQDMAGAATVFEAMRAASELKLKVNLIGITPLTENMPDGAAYKPGDVIGSLSGKTTEVISTDAEGRMVLADAITYAKNLGATHIIDIATLTGACIIALGDIASGIMGNNQDLIGNILKASSSAGEKMHQFPLYEEAKEYIKSPKADMKNCNDNRKAGTIVGGLYLQNFVEDTPWLHIDIAGTAYLDREIGYLGKGGTGAGVRTLVSFFMNKSD